MNDIPIFFETPTVLFICLHSIAFTVNSIDQSLAAYNQIAHSNAFRVFTLCFFHFHIAIASSRRECIIVGASFVDHISVIMLFHFDNRLKRSKGTAQIRSMTSLFICFCVNSFELHRDCVYACAQALTRSFVQHLSVYLCVCF